MTLTTYFEWPFYGLKCGLFDVLLGCVGLYMWRPLFVGGVCMWIEVVVMCWLRDFGIVYDWVWVGYWPKDVSRWFPMYWAHQNYSVCIICTFEMPLAFQKWFDSLCWICTLETHLSTYVNLFFKLRSSCSWWDLYVYVCRLHISP
jgi:hypothetical protein